MGERLKNTPKKERPEIFSGLSKNLLKKIT
jgi:hypothetical protein